MESRELHLRHGAGVAPGHDRLRVHRKLILGSVLGVMLGGIIAQRWGWQAAFGVVGVPGMILAVLSPGLPP
jgi:hypothetical protein